MLSVIYAELHISALYSDCHYTECCYAECRYAVCRGAIYTPKMFMKSAHGMLNWWALTSKEPTHLSGEPSLLYQT